MRLLDIPWTASPRQLRQFAGSCLAMLPLLAWLISGTSMMVFVAFGIGAALSIASWWRPLWVLPVFRFAILLAAPVGLVIGEAVLLLLYFALFVPLGLGLRLFGGDRLPRFPDPRRSSYWEEKNAARSPAHYYRQY